MLEIIGMAVMTSEEIALQHLHSTQRLVVARKTCKSSMYAFATVSALVVSLAQHRIDSMPLQLL